MVSRRLLLPLQLLLLSCAFAQLGKPDGTGNLRVRIVFTDGRRCSIQVRVQLMAGASNESVGDGFTNDECMVEFSGLRVGTYHLIVSGEGIQETDSGMIEVDSRKTTQTALVTVKRVGENDRSNDKDSRMPTVAAKDLNIPSEARKDFDKASDLIARENWNKAKERLMQALAIYPRYAAAYNNLGVVFGRLGDRAGEREALQKAVSLDDRFAPAYANLAKMDITDHNFSDAEMFLKKATDADPNSVQNLMLLANVELMNKHFDDAIANCHKVHSMPHQSEALVHYIAARALQHENRPADATAEFHLFLDEEPSGPRAEAVRKEMAALESGRR